MQDKRFSEPSIKMMFFHILSDKLKKIDLTANEITSIDERAFLGLPELEEVLIRENHISQLPAFPETMSLIDASLNTIGTKGIHKEAFKVRTTPAPVNKGQCVSSYKVVYMLTLLYLHFQVYYYVLRC